MNTYIVTEGKMDADILKLIFDAINIDNIAFIPAGGKAMVTSLVRSISIAHHVPVAAIVDADTTDHDNIRQQEIIANDLTRTTESDNHCKFFFAIPNLEEALFPEATDFESLFKTHLNPRQKESFIQNRKKIIFNFIRETPTPQVDKEMARKSLSLHGLDGIIQFLESQQENNQHENVF